MNVNLDKEAVTRLRKVIKPWGGEILVCSDEEFSKWRGDHLYQPSASFHAGPVRGIGIHLRKRLIIINRAHMEPANQEILTVANAIHEAAHLFAVPGNPENHDEFSFLGWEMRMALRIGLTLDNYAKGMPDYGLEDPDKGKEDWADDLGDCSKEQLERLYLDRRKDALTQGLLTRRGRLLCGRFKIVRK